MTSSPVLIVTPRGLEAEPLDGGRLLLRWQPSPGAGFHVILRARDGAPLRPIHWSYDPNRSTYVAGPCDGCRHVIKACRWPGLCTETAQWPIHGADGHPDPGHTAGADAGQCFA